MQYFLQKHVDSYVEIIKLNKGDCEHMLLTKRCDKYEMDCVGNRCRFEGSPSIEYEWGRKLKAENFSCTLNPIYIRAKETTDYLLDSKCLVFDGHCQLSWHNQMLF